MAKADKKDKKVEEKSKKAKAKAQEIEEEDEDLEEDDLDIDDLDLEADDDDEDAEEPDYEGMSVKELKALCTDREIDFDKKATKEDLIELLEADDEDEDEDDEDEEPEPPAKGKKAAAPEKTVAAKPGKDKAPAKDDKKDAKKNAPAAGAKPPMLQDIPEGHLSTTDVADMCGIDPRKLRAVLRKEFYADNESKRYHWAPGSKELNEILAYFGVKPAGKKDGKTSKKNK